MLLGRSLFGMGAEFLLLVQLIDIAFWFQHDGYNKAVGISQAIPNALTFFSSLILPKLAESRSVEYVFNIGSGTCIFSMMVALLYIWLKSKHKPTKEIEAEEPFVFSDIICFEKGYWLLCLDGMINYGLFYSTIAFS